MKHQASGGASLSMAISFGGIQVLACVVHWGKCVDHCLPVFERLTAPAATIIGVHQLHISHPWPVG
ncbi:hypothetical protein SEA_LEOZINHO_40 [Mycobacterium phage Leozinho]|nr:hypothetical protein SEA_LEOZINHO_40 [Mycobacterium phage Leozinho]WNT44558.1 hypothetical protein SEA_BLUECRAB_38 [Mycobacterium phage BlueCrab]